MHLEAILYFEESLSCIFRNLTDSTNLIWRSDVKEVKVIDDTHFIEYSNQDYPTFFTIVKKTKNKKYELEFVNNDLEGMICYQIQKKDDKSSLSVSLDVTFMNAKSTFLAKRKFKRRWKTHIEDLYRVGK